MGVNRGNAKVDSSVKNARHRRRAGSASTSAYKRWEKQKNLQSCIKLKLQLFPVDEGTRRALEMDNHNPFLELTLSNRKKMSSVMEHLNRKWGSSTIATVELVLFPFHVQMESLVRSMRWTKHATQSAADVHNLIGRPPVFRLKSIRLVSKC